MKVPWTERRSNQSILKEINPGCSLEGIMLKLKLQYFGHLMQRVDSLEKTQSVSGSVDSLCFNNTRRRVPGSELSHKKECLVHRLPEKTTPGLVPAHKRHRRF